MKAIIKKSKKTSLLFRCFVFTFLFVGFVSVVASIFFTGDREKKEGADFTYSGHLLSPSCSAAGGFRSGPVFVRLSAAADCRIHYTTDGSEPGPSSAEYEGPIRIDDRTKERNLLSGIPTSPRWLPPVGDVFKGTVIRAVAVNERNERSAELVRTFLVSGTRNNYTLPLVAITMNRKDLFGQRNGIYVMGKAYTDKDNYIRKRVPLDLPWWEYPANYHMRGADAERPAFIEFYEPNGEAGFQVEAGVRINGNATRGFAQKSLRVSLKDGKIRKSISYDLYRKGELNFSSFILRNSGNDWNRTMIRDVFMQSLMEGSHVDLQNSRPAIVFINAEYWGIHHVQERIDEYCLANRYHLKSDSITILESGGKVLAGNKDDQESFRDLVDFVAKNDLSVAANYKFVVSRMDLSSFIDFVIANIYFCNSDWPNNNVKMWMFHGHEDGKQVESGKWRWILYDTDWGFGYNSASTPSSDIIGKAMSQGNVGILFSGLMKNPAFKEQFLSRFQFHLDSTFEPQKVTAVIDDLEEILRPEMQEHIDRWRAIPSLGAWAGYIRELRVFASERPAYQAAQLNDYFHLSAEQQIRVNK